MLNLNDVPFNGGDNKIEPLEPGLYPARLVEVIGLGLQKGRQFKGDAKPPAREIILTFELLDEYLIDKDGEPILDKPRFFSYQFPIYHLKNSRATSTAVYEALDPKGIHKGDLAALVNTPCMVQLILSDKGKNFVNSVKPMRPKEAIKAKELVNPTMVFDPYDFDQEIFDKLKGWQQELVKEALDWDNKEPSLEVDQEGAKQPIDDEIPW